MTNLEYRITFLTPEILGMSDLNLRVSTTHWNPFNEEKTRGKRAQISSNF